MFSVQAAFLLTPGGAAACRHSLAANGRDLLLGELYACGFRSERKQGERDKTKDKK
jgi:hypothetical protein